MRSRLRATPSLVIAVIALFVAIGGGYAIGAGFIGTGDLKNQAVTNKKIKKKTIKANRVAPNTLTGDQIDEASLSGAGTGLAIREDGADAVPGGTTNAQEVLTLQVPKAGSYLFISKVALAKASAPDGTQVNCLLTAGGDADASREDIGTSQNNTMVNLVAHTFTGAGSVVLSCDNAAANVLLVTNKVISGIPLGALSSTVLP
jgi:hypothetical protein